MLAAVEKTMPLFGTTFELGRQILPESSSEIYVEQLGAATDAEDRLFKRNGGVKDGPLPFVPSLVDLAELWRGLLAITLWINILAAAENDCIAPRDHLSYLRLVVSILKDDRLEARAPDVIYIFPANG